MSPNSIGGVFPTSANGNVNMINAANPSLIANATTSMAMNAIQSPVQPMPGPVDASGIPLAAHFASPLQAQSNNLLPNANLMPSGLYPPASANTLVANGLPNNHNANVGTNTMFGNNLNMFDHINGMSPTHSGANMNFGISQALPTVVTLDPSRTNNDTLDRACQQTWLKEVCLKGCKSISNFTPLSRLHNLWKLNLQGCSQFVDDSVVKLIGTFNKRLSRLNLCGCERVTDATPLSNLAFLFDLNLSGSQIGNESLQAISQNCLQLSRLAINSCVNITDITCVSNLK